RRLPDGHPGGPRPVGLRAGHVRRGRAVLGGLPGGGVRGGRRRGGGEGMTPTRPCRCDRFLAGRRYVEGRDRPRSRMFAHRPSVRRAWGGNPADCDALLAAHRNMKAADLADLLAGPPPLMPDGWRLWPVTRKAHLMLTGRFLADPPPYPEGR